MVSYAPKRGDIQGAILCDQIRSLDWKARKAKFGLHLSGAILDDAMAKFRILLPT